MAGIFSRCPLPTPGLQPYARLAPHSHPHSYPHPQLVVNIAREYTEQLSSGKIIELLEAYNCYNGMYLYLGSRMAVSEVRFVCFSAPTGPGLYQVSVSGRKCYGISLDMWTVAAVV